MFRLPTPRLFSTLRRQCPGLRFLHRSRWRWRGFCCWYGSAERSVMDAHEQRWLAPLANRWLTHRRPGLITALAWLTVRVMKRLQLLKTAAPKQRTRQDPPSVELEHPATLSLSLVTGVFAQNAISTAAAICGSYRRAAVIGPAGSGGKPRCCAKGIRPTSFMPRRRCGA
ncbi:hypothetical protein KCP69_18500 [Salmonella enterica subsp. enterica]|nr:hypothetical protein KCP69_18500 [Salmonella enterica subsp. enterica]